MALSLLVGVLAGVLRSAHADAADAVASPSVSRVDELFADIGAAAPGCAVGASVKGAHVHLAGYGLADLEQRMRIGPDTVFNVASVSKQFTAFAVLLLHKQRRLSIDDPIARYLPQLPRYAQAVTIRDLLLHLGGLREYVALLSMQGRGMEEAVTEGETLELIARQREPNQPPGEIFEYSNTGYFLLGLIVERASGRSLRSFSREQIFEPLGMAATTIVDAYPPRLPRLARGYAQAKDGFELNESKWQQVGDGQVHTTVRDLLRWQAGLRNGALIGKDLVQLMSTSGATKNGASTHYGMALTSSTYRGLPLLRHGGAWAGYRAELAYFPQQDAAIAVLCNRSDLTAQTRAEAVATVLLQQFMRKESAPPFIVELATPPGSTEAARLRDGLYRDAFAVNYARLESRAGEPSLFIDGWDMQLTPAEGRIRGSGAVRDLYVVFRGASTERPAQILTQRSRGGPRSYERVWAWQPDDLAFYVGRYRSEEIGLEYLVAMTPEGLMLQMGEDRMALQPGVANEFFSADTGVSIRFEGGSPRPTRLRYFFPGIRGMAFERQSERP